jgi:Fur family transcriptional regulator, ferric uptake regulator
MAEELVRALPAGRTTRQRLAVLHALADHQDFVSAQRLHALMTSGGIRVGLSTVYRVLRGLEASGRADVVRDEAGERLYRPRPVTGRRHYLFCRCCGHSRPVDTEVVQAWAEQVGREAGFTAVELTVELTGLCARCRTASPAAAHAEKGDPSCRSEPARPGTRRSCSHH